MKRAHIISSVATMLFALVLVGCEDRAAYPGDVTSVDYGTSAPDEPSEMIVEYFEPEDRDTQITVVYRPADDQFEPIDQDVEAGLIVVDEPGPDVILDPIIENEVQPTIVIIERHVIVEAAPVIVEVPVPIFVEPYYQRTSYWPSIIVINRSSDRSRHHGRRGGHGDGDRHRRGDRARRPAEPNVTTSRRARSSTTVQPPSGPVPLWVNRSAGVGPRPSVTAARPAPQPSVRPPSSSRPRRAFRQPQRATPVVRPAARVTAEQVVQTAPTTPKRSATRRQRKRMTRAAPTRTIGPKPRQATAPSAPAKKAPKPKRTMARRPATKPTPTPPVKVAKRRSTRRAAPASARAARARVAQLQRGVLQRARAAKLQLEAKTAASATGEQRRRGRRARTKQVASAR